MNLSKILHANTLFYRGSKFYVGKQKSSLLDEIDHHIKKLSSSFPARQDPLEEKGLLKRKVVKLYKSVKGEEMISPSTQDSPLIEKEEVSTLSIGKEAEVARFVLPRWIETMNVPPPPKVDEIISRPQSKLNDCIEQVELKEPPPPYECPPKKDQSTVLLSEADVLNKFEPILFNPPKRANDKKTPPPLSSLYGSPFPRNLENQSEIEPFAIESLFSSESPKLLFVTLNKSTGEVIKNALLSGSNCGEEESFCEIIAVSELQALSNWPHQESLERVVIAVDNLGEDPKENMKVFSLITHFLSKGVQLTLSIPKSKGVDVECSFFELSQEAKGFRRCGAILRRGVEISSVTDLEGLNGSLGMALQKLVEKRDRIRAGVPEKETIEQRIQSASSIYERGIPVTRDNVVAVNLELRGIKGWIPRNFRAVLIHHPDGPHHENQKIFKSEDQRTPLLKALKSSSLIGKVVYYGKNYYRITSDERFEGVLTSLILQRGEERVSLTIQGDDIQINGESISPSKLNIEVCAFKRFTRVIPYYNKENQLTGIERAFLSADASKPDLGKRRTKLGRGLPAGSSARLFWAKNPEFKVLGEGAENVFTALQALRNFPLQAKKLGLDLGLKTSNCEFITALGVSDLIKVPIQTGIHTLFLLIDIDGFNRETKQSMIEAIDRFIKKGLEVRIVFANSKVIGQKRDLNDLLQEEGLERVVTAISQYVKIKSIDDLGPLNEPMQLSLEYLKLKQLEVSPKNLLLAGQKALSLGKYPEASENLKKVLSLNNRDLEGEVQHSLGELNFAKGSYDTAIDSFEKSIRLKILKGESPRGMSVLSSLEGITKCYRKKKEFTKALSLAGKIFQLKEQFFSTDMDQNFFSLYLELGKINVELGDFDRALFSYERALILKEKEMKSRFHPEIGEILEAIGDIYSELEDPEKALENYKYAQEIFHKTYCSERHEKDEQLCRKAASILVEKKRLLDSLEFSRKSFGNSSASPILRALLRRAHAVYVKNVEPKSVPYNGARFSSISFPKPEIKPPYPLSFSILRERGRRVRQIVIDFEMTGTDPEKDRITEIGCVEMGNLQRTGGVFQAYVNPGVPVRRDAERITGLTHNFLSNYPRFAEVTEQFLPFVQGADLIFHGAQGDMNFFRAELKRAGLNYDLEQHWILDTYEMARILFPNDRNSLDALNKRYKFEHPREKHAALLDAQITADVYRAMLLQRGS